MEAFKIELDSGKEVVFRTPVVGDQEKAAERVGKESNQNTYMLKLQNELVKVLLHSINGKKLGGAEKQDLKNLFEFDEYTQLLLAIDNILPKPKAPKVNAIIIED